MSGIKKRYEKLVRDKVVELIEGRGQSCSWHTATEEEFERLLPLKLVEEVDEFVSDRTLIELADVHQVNETCVSFYGFDRAMLEQAKEQTPLFERDELRDPDVEFDAMMDLRDAATTFAASPNEQRFHKFLRALWTLTNIIFDEQSVMQLEARRLQKLEECGGFDARIVLDAA